MRNLFYISILSYCIATMLSCRNSSKDSSDAVEAVNPISEKKTQALILTQDFDYNPDDRNKIAGEYISHKKITVPQNLGPQNKWFMFEGPVLENDLVAYRFYGDSRHRTDIYGKISSDLVMDTVSWDYHNIMNWGSDILKVGNSLGIGSPAIWYQDSLYTLSNCQEKTIEIVQSHNDISTVRTKFKKLSVAGEVFDLVQDWSIEAGQPWSEIHLKVTKGSLPDGMYYATGIVKHLPDIMEGELGDSFYAMNWGQQSFHDENMGMAITVEKKYKPELIKDDLSHAYKFTNANQEVRYRFLSAWERDNNKIKDAIAFKKIVEQAAQ